MQFEETSIGGVWLIKPRFFRDDRGYFAETFKENAFREATGESAPFVQDNQSFSIMRGTVRGLHYQSPPKAQGKLVRCLAGRAVDVVVDWRTGSATFGQHLTFELSADNGHQVWVPAGFLHGFSTLEDNTLIAYKVTDYYSPECDGNIAWNDPDLAIDWGIDANVATLSQKDANAPSFAATPSPF